jgi:hypothetical protein
MFAILSTKLSIDTSLKNLEERALYNIFMRKHYRPEKMKEDFVVLPLKKLMGKIVTLFLIYSLLVF